MAAPRPGRERFIFLVKRTCADCLFHRVTAGDPGADSETGALPTPNFPALKMDRKPRSTARKPSAAPGAPATASRAPNSESASTAHDAAPPPDSLPDARAAEEKVRAAEEATGHLVALEREELDRLSDRVRAMNDRIDAAQKQQPAPSPQLRDDLAFGQQRLQNCLYQADNALKIADVQTAQRFLDQGKAELEKLAKILRRQ